WSQAMELVGQRLDLTWPRPLNDARAEVDVFLDVGARHRRPSARASDASGDASNLLPFVAEVFEQCLRASTSESAWPDLCVWAAPWPRSPRLCGACLDDFIGYATQVRGRVQHAGTIPAGARPEPGAILDGTRDVSRALAALTPERADLQAVTRSLQLHAGLVE